MDEKMYLLEGFRRVRCSMCEQIFRTGECAKLDRGSYDEPPCVIGYRCPVCGSSELEPVVFCNVCGEYGEPYYENDDTPICRECGEDTARCISVKLWDEFVDDEFTREEEAQFFCSDIWGAGVTVGNVAWEIIAAAKKLWNGFSEQEKRDVISDALSDVSVRDRFFAFLGEHEPPEEEEDGETIREELFGEEKDAETIQRAS